jgi:hypothetical protein
VLKHNPAHFGALACYGRIHPQLGQLEKAVEHFNRAPDVHPDMQGVRPDVEDVGALLAARPGVSSRSGLAEFSRRCHCVGVPCAFAFVRQQELNHGQQPRRRSVQR